MKTKTPVSLTLDKEIVQKMKELSIFKNKNMSRMVNDILIDYFKKTKREGK